MTTSDPRWTVEFSVNDNKFGARREVRVDAAELAEAVGSAVAGMQAVFGQELQRAVRAAGEAFPELRDPLGDPLEGPHA